MALGDLFKASDKEDYAESVKRVMPTYPGASLTGHVVLKSVQVGSAVGSVAAFGMWLKSSETGFKSLLLQRWPRYAGIGGAVGVLSAGAMMYSKMQSIEIDGLEDRAYRIAVNKGIQTMDFYSILGGISCLLVGFSTRGSGAGVVATALGKRLLTPWSLMAQGIAAGSMVYALGNGVGLPLQKPLELLRFPGFEPEDESSEESS